MAPADEVLRTSRLSSVVMLQCDTLASRQKTRVDPIVRRDPGVLDIVVALAAKSEVVMYCSQCGAEATGNFCSSCGAPLQAKASPAVQATDWSGIIEYEALLRVPEIRDLLARHATQSKKRMTGEEFLQYCDKAIVALTGVPMVPTATVASVAQPIYAKLGIKTGETRSQIFNKPPGTILVAVLCSLARHGRHLRQVRQVQDGCILEAVIPSDIWSFEGDLVITVRREGTGTFAEAGTIIKGQLFDWGKSERCLKELFTDLSTMPAII